MEVSDMQLFASFCSLGLETSLHLSLPHGPRVDPVLLRDPRRIAVSFDRTERRAHVLPSLVFTATAWSIGFSSCPGFTSDSMSY